MASGLIIVDGHGEADAAEALIRRLWRWLKCTRPIDWRTMRLQVRTRGEADRVANIARSLAVDAVLVLRDADILWKSGVSALAAARERAGWFAESKLPAAVALAFIEQEFEALFLPSLATMSPLVISGAKIDRDPQAIRGVKEALRKVMIGGSYKPTAHQLVMTQMIDFDLLDAEARLTCFKNLCAALRFIDSAEKFRVHP